tara:strand:- start:117 stop:410 length:294 start_codon:yes stop_codon:yes gene_type:complete
VALEIIWTKRAINGYDNIIKYLEENWTEREVRNFVKETTKFFELLVLFPEILEKSSRQKNTYRGPMDKHSIITYRVKSRNKQIQILNIRSAKRKPLK